MSQRKDFQSFRPIEINTFIFSKEIIPIFKDILATNQKFLPSASIFIINWNDIPFYCKVGIHSLQLGASLWCNSCGIYVHSPVFQFLHQHQNFPDITSNLLENTCIVFRSNERVHIERDINWKWIEVTSIC